MMTTTSGFRDQPVTRKQHVFSLWLQSKTCLLNRNYWNSNCLWVTAGYIRMFNGFQWPLFTQISRPSGAVDDRAGSKELGAAHHGLLEWGKKWLFTKKDVELTNDWDTSNSHKERIGIWPTETEISEIHENEWVSHKLGISSTPGISPANRISGVPKYLEIPHLAATKLI